jgi:hypothetical protein
MADIPLPVNPRAPKRPYWTELGYQLSQQTGLFYRPTVRQDGSTGEEVLVDAERFHRIRKENLRRLGVRDV